MKSKFILSFIPLIMVACHSTQKIAECIKTENMKETKSFSISITDANPVKMRPTHFSGDYYLIMRNDSVFAHLPYIGQVHSIVASTNQDKFNFSKPVSNLRITSKNQSDEKIYVFTVILTGELLNFKVSVQRETIASISMNSTGRDFISYYGKIIDKNN